MNTCNSFLRQSSFVVKKLTFILYEEKMQRLIRDETWTLVEPGGFFKFLFCFREVLAPPSNHKSVLTPREVKNRNRQGHQLYSFFLLKTVLLLYSFNVLKTNRITFTKILLFHSGPPPLPSHFKLDSTLHNF